MRSLAASCAVPPLPLAFIHGDAWPQPDVVGARRPWIDFERSRFATAVQDFVHMACSAWADRPRLRAACSRATAASYTARSGTP